MKLLKPQNNHQSVGKPKPIDRFAFITDDRTKLVIPVGPRFQAEVPPWNPPCSRSRQDISDNESAYAKRIGTQIWPMKGRSGDVNDNMVGKGRSETCECVFPRSIECVKKHVSQKRFHLRIDLGPAFWKWKFDEMGEYISVSWSPQEEKKFEYVVKMTAESQGKSFVDSAIGCLPDRCKRSIVSYYLNVYIPRRISVQTRSSCVTIDTDNDIDVNDVQPPKGPRKRLQANSSASKSCKYVKNKYLRGRR